MLNRLENVNKQNIHSRTGFNMKTYCQNNIKENLLEYIHTVNVLPNDMFTVYEIMNLSESIWKKLLDFALYSIACEIV